MTVRALLRSQVNHVRYFTHDRECSKRYMIQPENGVKDSQNRDKLVSIRILECATMILTAPTLDQTIVNNATSARNCRPTASEYIKYLTASSSWTGNISCRGLYDGRWRYERWSDVRQSNYENFPDYVPAIELAQREDKAGCFSLGLKPPVSLARVSTRQVSPSMLRFTFTY